MLSTLAGAGSNHDTRGFSAGTVARTLTLLVALAFGWASAQAVFSQYVEGSGHNKALEILNTSTEPFALSGCQVRMYFNGDENADLRLFGTLNPGELLVVFHEEEGGNYPHGFHAAVNAAPNTISGGFGWFNGNDAIELACHGRTIDSIGQVGNDDYWGKDTTLFRDDLTPDTDMTDAFDAAVWVETAKDDFTGVGQP